MRYGTNIRLRRDCGWRGHWRAYRGGAAGARWIPRAGVGGPYRARRLRLFIRAQAAKWRSLYFRCWGHAIRRVWPWWGTSLGWEKAWDCLAGAAARASHAGMAA